MIAGRSADLARRYAPLAVAGDATERSIAAHQSNDSVVVGERVVVKWLVPPRLQPHPAVELLAHLTAVGFVEMPEFFAAHEERGRVVAMITAFVPGAVDGWEWYVDELTTALDDDVIDAPLETARHLGALTGRLHLALATPSAVIPEPLARGSLGDEVARGRKLLDDALHETPGAVGERLAARARRVRAAIAALDDIDHIAVQPVHGDLHAGQFLRTGSTIVVNDFDGNPIAEPGVGVGRRSHLVDVAALLQSIDHVGRIVANYRSDLAGGVASFLDLAIGAAWREYSAVVAPTDDDETVLTALRAIQELHEYLYAARSLPSWLYVPDAALSAMFP